MAAGRIANSASRAISQTDGSTPLCSMLLTGPAPTRRKAMSTKALPSVRANSYRYSQRGLTRAPSTAPATKVATNPLPPAIWVEAKVINASATAAIF